MMIALKLAYRNLVGAGLRTWLNVGVLSFIYVLIIWHQGLFSGMYAQASRDVLKDEVAGGHYRHQKYDPFDPLTLEESHARIPRELIPLIQSGRAAPILIRQGAIYPGGRIQSVLINGIDPGQGILDIPTAALDRPGSPLPIMIGKMTARKNSLKIGSVLTLRWRDADGAFDAVDGEIVRIMETNVPGIDLGRIWVSLERLGEMSALDGQATVIVVGREVKEPAALDGWEFKGPAFLMKDLTDMIRSKRVGSAFMYAILMFLALLAVFDTQVLSIFRRRKEIGTLMALGLVRSKIVVMFTLEGAMYGLLGMAAAALYGIPVLVLSARTGIPLPIRVEEYGFALAARLFPVYSPRLIGGTILIIMLTVIIVSYLPSRKISGWRVTEALKGKAS